MKSLIKWIDVPPVWLGGFLAIAWGATKVGFVTDGRMPVQAVVGWALVVIGFMLMGLAIFEMSRKRTTVIPHMQPTALVNTGIFAVSRNPIYLGDALILAGFTLIWNTSIIFLLLVPAFMFVITRRFVLPEENRLNQAFGADFATYSRTTRRWI